MRTRILRRNDFQLMIDRINGTLLKTGKIAYDQEEFKASFFRQASRSPENLKAIECIEFGTWRNKYLDGDRYDYGLKIKGYEIAVSDLAWYLESDDDAVEMLSESFPELTMQEIEAAQRVVSVVMFGMECEEFLIDEDEYQEWKRKVRSSWAWEWLLENSICLGDKTILRYNNFLTMIDRITRTLLETGNVHYDEREFKKSFFRQVSQSPDNEQAMEFIEYGAVKSGYLGGRTRYGLKIRGKDVLVSDLVRFLENREESVELLAKEFPELNREEIRAALRVITVIMSGLDCEEIRVEGK